MIAGRSTATNARNATAVAERELQMTELLRDSSAISTALTADKAGVDEAGVRESTDWSIEASVHGPDHAELGTGGSADRRVARSLLPTYSRHRTEPTRRSR